jgi:hypothetical protein
MLKNGPLEALKHAHDALKWHIEDNAVSVSGLECADLLRGAQNNPENPMEAFKVFCIMNQKSVNKPPPFNLAVSEIGKIKGFPVAGFEVLNISRVDHQRLPVSDSHAQRSGPFGAAKLSQVFHGKSPGSVICDAKPLNQHE